MRRNKEEKNREKEIMQRLAEERSRLNPEYYREAKREFGPDIRDARIGYVKKVLPAAVKGAAKGAVYGIGVSAFDQITRGNAPVPRAADIPLALGSAAGNVVTSTEDIRFGHKKELRQIDEKVIGRAKQIEHERQHAANIIAKYFEKQQQHTNEDEKRIRQKLENMMKKRGGPLY